MAKILIVDDDEGERLLLQACLERAHELVFAREGAAAEDAILYKPLELAELRGVVKALLSADSKGWGPLGQHPRA